MVNVSFTTPQNYSRGARLKTTVESMEILLSDYQIIRTLRLD
jgi:hypothetical protein